MSIPILTMKFYIPKLHDKAVIRPHLIKKMKEEGHSRLMLISAPAGYGKTTLACEWLSACGSPAVWLSLEERDNDLKQFLTYFILGLQSIDKSIGESAFDTVSSLQSVGTEAILTELISKIAEIPFDFVYVLDDYHVIRNQDINAAVTFLLNYMPDNMKFVITTREDPQLPLAKLRVRNQLLEFRQADLRFSQFEIAQYLNGMGFHITEHNLMLLDKYTEGWIAGIQLAALAMQRQDVGDFIEHLSAGHTYIMDYLLEEVLMRQPEELQRFLLKTSILDRFCSELCDTVLEYEIPSSQLILEQLQAVNLFLIPLDNEKRWYRYHHLFAELLLQRWKRDHALSQEAAQYHMRAANWFEQKGFMEEAIHHILAAGDFEKAAARIELEWFKMDQSLQNAIWLKWVKLLPEELIRLRPVICTGYAWALLDAGELDGCEPMLKEAERGMAFIEKEEQEGSLLSRRVTDWEAYRKLPAFIANARAYKASSLGDFRGAVRYAKQALELLPEEDYYAREVIKTLLGLSLWADGDLEAAYSTIAQGLLNQQMEIMVAVVLAEIRIEQCYFRKAEELLSRVLKAALQEENAYQLPIASFYLGLARLKFYQGEITYEEELLEQSRGAGDVSALPNWRYLWLIFKAQLAESRGEYTEALDYIREAEGCYHKNPIPDLITFPAMRARIYLKQGNLEKAICWVDETPISFTAEPEYAHIYEYITLLRIRLKEYELHRMEDCGQVIRAAEHALEKARSGKWNRTMVELLVLLAKAYDLTGKVDLAQERLTEAIHRSGPEEYIYPFTEAGESLYLLFVRIAGTSDYPQFTRRVIDSIKLKKEQRDSAIVKSSSRLAEPLTERELEILRLISDGLSNQEICDKLFLALSTVKGYNQNLFGKLQVKSRTEAIKRARELEMIDRS